MPMSDLMDSALYIVVIAFYMVALAAVGWLGKKKVSSISDWYVGGFKIGGVVMGVAFFATYFSAVLMIGFAGSASKWGMSATVIGMWHAVSAVIAFAVLAPRLSKAFRELNAMTFSEFLSLRYGSKTLRYASALIIAIFIIPYTVSAFIAMGSAISTIVGTPFWMGVLVAGAIIAVYVFSGGLFSATLAEFIQGIVMTIAVVAVWVFSYSLLGGFVQAHETMAAIDIRSVTFPAFGTNTWSVIIGLTAVMGFGMLAQPQMVLRYATISSRMNIKRALLIATFGSLLFPLAAYSYGALSRPILAKFGIDVMTLKDDLIVPLFVKTAFPPWLSVLFLAGIMCAATSTIDALIHMTAGTLTRDLVRPASKMMSDKTQLRMTKLISLILSLGCCIIAIYPPGLIYQLTAYTWQVLSSSFMGPLVMALFYRRANKYGALAGMVAGFASAQLWYLFLAPPATPIYPFFPGVAASLIVTYLVSRFTGPKQA
jgi:SSS family solute:Na+ symporter